MELGEPRSPMHEWITSVDDENYEPALRNVTTPEEVRVRNGENESRKSDSHLNHSLCLLLISLGHLDYPVSDSCVASEGMKSY